MSTKTRSTYTARVLVEEEVEEVPEEVQEEACQRVRVKGGEVARIPSTRFQEAMSANLQSRGLGAVTAVGGLTS